MKEPEILRWLLDYAGEREMEVEVQGGTEIDKNENITPEDLSEDLKLNKTSQIRSLSQIVQYEK